MKKVVVRKSKGIKPSSNRLYTLLGVVFLLIVMVFGAVTFGNKLRQANNRKIEIERLKKEKLTLEIKLLKIETKKITR